MGLTRSRFPASIIFLPSSIVKCLSSFSFFLQSSVDILPLIHLDTFCRDLAFLILFSYHFPFSYHRLQLNVSKILHMTCQICRLLQCSSLILGLRLRFLIPIHIFNLNNISFNFHTSPGFKLNTI